MKVSLFTVPVELAFTELMPTVRADTDVFVSNRSDSQLPVMPKIAIVNLVNWMERNGYTKRDYDYYDVDMLMPTDEEIIDYLKQYKPTVVGLSAVVSTCYAQVNRLTELIKKVNPETWVVLGGSLTASSNLVLRRTKVDICVVGDGEKAWVSLLDYIKHHGTARNYDALKGIVGLAYIDKANELIFTGYGEPIHGKENTYPDYEILRMGLRGNEKAFTNYFRKGLGSTQFATDPRSHETWRRPMLAQLWTSKGCVARCTFCQRSTKGNRTFDLSKLDEHLKLLSEKYDVGFIHILDENFGSDNEYSRGVAEVMHENGMLWMASGLRVSSMNFELIKHFKEHGCASLKFGVESGSQKIMNIMEKKFTVEKVREILGYCAHFGMFSPLAVMVGMPGETNATARQTGEFVGELCYEAGIHPKFAGISVFYALPLTGTPLYVYGQQAGVLGKSPAEEEEYLLSVSGTGANKINYINLNGSKMYDILWWDWLVTFEATRKYLSLVKERGQPQLGFMQKTIISDKEREIVGRALTLREVLEAIGNLSLNGVRAKLFYLGDSIVQRIVTSDTAARIPRAIVVPPLRLMIYLQYVLQGVVLKLAGKEFNLWKKWNPIKQINDPSEFKQGVDIKLSLRRIVRSNNEVKNLAPDVQDTLSIGL